MLFLINKKIKFPKTALLTVAKIVLFGVRGTENESKKIQYTSK